MPLIEAHDLAKTFSRTRRVEGRFSTLRTLVTRQRDTTTAVDGISFAIDEGEMVGYLGPNGAGKSTTIKMLTGILIPTSGGASVAGLEGVGHAAPRPDPDGTRVVVLPVRVPPVPVPPLVKQG